MALVRTNTVGTVIPFALMASAALMLVVLWQRSRGALGGARRAAARDLALPALDVSRAAGDAARAHRSADRPRQPPPLPRAAAARARRGGGARRSTLSLCLVDLDDFKHINDAYGHPTGDRVLSQVARGCARAARRSGSAATSSPCSSPSRTRRRRSTTADVDRRAPARDAARARRADHGQRRRRDVPGAGRRPRRADPARRQRALLGEGARQEPRARATAPRSSSSPS